MNVWQGPAGDVVHLPGMDVYLRATRWVLRAQRGEWLACQVPERRHQRVYLEKALIGWHVRVEMRVPVSLDEDRIPLG